MVLITVIVSINLNRLSAENFHHYMKNLVESIDESISLYLSQSKTNINTLSQNPALRRADSSIPTYLHTTTPTIVDGSRKTGLEKQIFEHLDRVIGSNSDYIRIFYGTRYGSFIPTGVNEVVAAFDPTIRPWYTAAVEKPGEVVITETYLSTDGHITLAASKAVFDFRNEIVGVISGEISMRSLSTFLQNIDMGKSGFMMLVHRDGTILANTGDESTVLKKMNNIGISDFEKIQNGDSGFYRVKINGVHYKTIVHSSSRLGWKIIGFREHREVMTFTNKVRQNILLVTIFFVTLFGLASIYTTQRMLIPLKQTTDALSKLSVGEGDLTQRIPVKADEIGEMALEFNKFLQIMQTMISEISNVMDELLASAEDVAKSSEYLNTSAHSMNLQVDDVFRNTDQIKNITLSIAVSSDEASTNVKQVSEAIQNVSANMNVVASSSKQANSLMEMTTTEIGTIDNRIRDITSRVDEVVSAIYLTAISIEEMSLALNETSLNTTKANILSNEVDAHAKASSKVMQSLDQAAIEIGKILKVINDLAKQTNLLSLNASIEVANASGSGKVFSVLSTEAKQLTKQTRDETERISAQIEAIQDSIANAVLAIDQITNGIHDLNLINNTIAVNIDEQSIKINDIATTISNAVTISKQMASFIKTTNDGILQIGTNVTESHEGIKNIHGSYENIASITDVLSTNSIEASTGVSNIAKSSTEISHDINEIVTTIGGIATTCKQFAVEARKLNNSSNSLKTLSQKLDEMIAKFKVE
jgi:methyl-accepting chemotaxis protein